MKRLSLPLRYSCRKVEAARIGTQQVNATPSAMDDERAAKHRRRMHCARRWWYTLPRGLKTLPPLLRRRKYKGIVEDCIAVKAAEHQDCLTALVKNAGGRVAGARRRPSEQRRRLLTLRPH